MIALRFVKRKPNHGLKIMQRARFDDSGVGRAMALRAIVGTRLRPNSQSMDALGFQHSTAPFVRMPHT